MNQFFKYFKNDFLGGITAGIVALPLALAFGVSSGLGPSAGLYGAIILGFFAALFGGTKTQISGPTAPMTAVSMVIIAGLIAAHDGNVARALPAILMIFFLAGVFQILLGVLKLGKYVKFIPHSVVSGFMTAIGVLIIIGQLLPILGYSVSNDTDFVNEFRPHAQEKLLETILYEEADEGLLVLEDFEETIKRAKGISPQQIDEESIILAKKEASGIIGNLKVLPRALNGISWTELLIALITIFIIYGFKYITKKIPSTLIALLVVSVGVIALNIPYKSIQQIPEGFPIPQWQIFTEFNFSSIAPYILTALTLSLLGAIDSLLTSIVADNITKTRHNSNKELIGQGIGNSLSSVFGGIPGAGATIRTVVNIQAGGKTQLSGMVASLLLLVILLFLGPIASKIPAAVLAGILFTVGIGVMDFKGLKSIPKLPLPDVIIMLVVMILSVFWDLVFAVGIGLVMASLSFMKKMGDHTAKNTKHIPIENEKTWDDENGFIKKFKGKVLIKHINGPLFFGSTASIMDLVNRIPENIDYLIVRMDKVNLIDQSGLVVMEDMILRMEQNNIEVLLVDLQDQPRYRMEAIDIIPDLISQEHIFDSINTCEHYLSNLEKHNI